MALFLSPYCLRISFFNSIIAFILFCMAVFLAALSFATSPKAKRPAAISSALACCLAFSANGRAFSPAFPISAIILPILKPLPALFCIKASPKAVAAVLKSGFPDGSRPVAS